MTRALLQGVHRGTRGGTNRKDPKNVTFKMFEAGLKRSKTVAENLARLLNYVIYKKQNIAAYLKTHSNYTI